MPWLAVASARTPSVAATTCAETTSHTLVRTRISGAVCRSSRVRARVARSVTGPTVGGSAVAQGAQGALAGLAGEPVEEHLPVEVVDLVLQAARHQPAARQPQRLPVDVEALDDRVHRPHGRRPDAGDGQAPLVA